MQTQRIHNETEDNVLLVHSIDIQQAGATEIKDVDLCHNNFVIDLEIPIQANGLEMICLQEDLRTEERDLILDYSTYNVHLTRVCLF